LATFLLSAATNAKTAGQFNHCLADYIAADSPDYLAALRSRFTARMKLLKNSNCARRLQRHHYKSAGGPIGRAFAEYLHLQARIAWGFGGNENLSNADLIREKYRGIRPALVTGIARSRRERTLFDLLQAEDKIAIKLTESYAMHPGASVSGLYFSHPDAKYFGLARLGGTKLWITVGGAVNQSRLWRSDSDRTGYESENDKARMSNDEGMTKHEIDDECDHPNVRRIRRSDGRSFCCGERNNKTP